MSPIAHNYHNLNATRGFPLDDLATGLSDSGQRLPDGVLVDGCLRFPRPLGQYAYLMAVHASDKLVSCLIGAAETLDEVALQPIAALSVSGPLTPGRPYQLKALAAGVGGWLVLGQLGQNYSGRFSRVSQGLLLPRVARPYAPLPVPWMSKLLDEQKLEQIVSLFAGNDIEIVRAPREINGVTQDAIVIRLTGNPQEVHPRYVGPCGGRPDSRTCLLPALEGLGGAVPDAMGDIQLSFEELSPTAVPHGILLNTDLTLPELCGTTLLTHDTVQDFCSEVSEISEVSETNSEANSESEGASESETAVTYPRCVRIFSVETPPFDYPYGNWSHSNNYPPSFPCSAFGHPSNTWQALKTGVTAPTFENPTHSHVAVFNDPDYTQAIDIRIEGAVRISNGFARAGLMFGYRKLTGLDRPAAFVARLSPLAQRVGLMSWSPVQQDQYLVSAGNVNILLDEWYKISVWIRHSGRDIDLKMFVDHMPGPGSPVATNFPVALHTVVPNSWPQADDGRFGLLALGHGVEFGYLHMNQI